MQLRVAESLGSLSGAAMSRIASGVAGALTLATMAFLAGPASAQRTKAWNACVDTKTTRALQIENCSAAIQAGGVSNADLSVAYYNRGKAYVQRMDDRAQGNRDLDKAIELNPGNISAIFERGLAYHNEENYDRAIEYYSWAIALGGSDPRPYRNRASLFFKLGKSDEAIRDYDRAIQVAPSSSYSFEGRGRVYTAKGEYDRAIQDFNEALRLYPSFGPYYDRGNAYAGKGDFDLALEDYDRAIKQIAAPHTPAMYAKGKIYVARGQIDRGIQEYNRALKFYPDDPEGFLHRGNAYVSRGQTDLAIRDFDQAIKLDSEDAQAFASRGNAYYAKGQFVRAIQDYDQAIKLSPNDASIFSNRGGAYTQSGQFDRAVKDYDEAIRLEPDSPDQYKSRGYAHFIAANYSGAASDLARSLTQTPDDSYLALWRYLALARSGSQTAVAALEADAPNLKSSEWPYAIVELYLGRRTAEATLASAGKPEERCGARYYVGQWHLLRNDRKAAVAALKGALEICQKNFIEYASAQAELKRLGP